MSRLHWCWGGALSLAVCGFANADNVSVERAAKTYRIQLFSAFQHDRTEFDRRRAVGDDLLKQWQDQGQREQETDVVDWFRLATWASTPGSVTDLPPTPELVRDSSPTGASVRPASTSRSPGLDGVGRPSYPTSRSDDPATSVPAASVKPAKLEAEESSSLGVLKSVGKSLLSGFGG